MCRILSVKEGGLTCLEFQYPRRNFTPFAKKTQSYDIPIKIECWFLFTNIDGQLVLRNNFSKSEVSAQLILIRETKTLDKKNLKIRLDTTYFAENWKYCSKIIFKCVKNYCSLYFLLFISLKSLFMDNE